MGKREFTTTSKILLLLAGFDHVASPLVNIYELRRRALYGNPRSLDATLHKLQKRGWLKFVDKNAERFLQLTQKGELELLMKKAFSPVPKPWDGTWTIAMYDIPEEVKGKRWQLRNLLKKSNFKQLQGSVYINPHPLNKEATIFLEKSGLQQYIRIMKVEYMGDDTALRKKFHLQ